MPKVTELIQRVGAAHSLGEAKRLVAELARDRRRRITPALRARVLKLAKGGMNAAAVTRAIGWKLSAPTVRKIIREGGKAKC
jgi:hypothetical protein